MICYACRRMFPIAIAKITEAITNKQLSWADIEMHCKKVLLAKYQYGLSTLKPVSLENLTADLNSQVPAMRKLVAENAITLLAKNDSAFFPLSTEKTAGEIAYLAIGIKADNAFATRMRTDHNAAVFYFDYTKKNNDSVTALVDKIVLGYKKVVIGIHGINRPPLNNFGISSQAVGIINTLQQRTRSITFLFGNAYAAKNWCFAKNLVVCYEDDSIVQNVALDLLQGKIPYKGVLPVTVCDHFNFGYGLAAVEKDLQPSNPVQAGMIAEKIAIIDSIAMDAIAKTAMPGCVVLVAKDGKIAYQKAFGYYTYENREPVSTASVYDMASVTKICATTLSIMKLYDEGKVDLKKKLGDYLPWVRGSNKAGLLIEKILLHQAGLVSSLSFYKETLDAAGVPLKKFYSPDSTSSFSIRVADHLFVRNDIKEIFFQKILKSPLGPAGRYIYSDIDFIFLGEIVEAVSGIPLDQYVRRSFYDPMYLQSAGFKPLAHIPVERIVPTEDEKIFRQQLLRGDVHDPTAAMLGEVAGHAGLFSDAYDIACIMQMLLNGGVFNGKRYLQKSTVDLFTEYQSDISRRGYGFDKPEKDNENREEPYPARSASSFTFGHTGFTGTCAWADPANNLIFIFLGNRVNPVGSDLFLKMNVRPKIHETIYQSIPKTS